MRGSGVLTRGAGWADTQAEGQAETVELWKHCLSGRTGMSLMKSQWWEMSEKGCWTHVPEEFKCPAEALFYRFENLVVLLSRVLLFFSSI